MDQESSNTDDITESTSDVEDLVLSDVDEMQSPKEILNIDYNSRVIFSETKGNCSSGDSCSTYFGKAGNMVALDEEENNTDSEKLDVSEDENESDSYLTLKSVNLNGISCISGQHVNPSSALNFSSRVFKNEYLTDKEFMSCGKNDLFGDFNFRQRHVFEGLNSLSVKNSGSSRSKRVSALGTANTFVLSLANEEKSLEQESALLTCSEFLNSDVSDSLTDHEDMCFESPDVMDAVTRNGHQKLDLLGIHARTYNGFGIHNSGELVNDDEVLTEDETFCMDDPVEYTKVSKRRNTKPTLESKQSESTDEELFDEEWTKTDENGAVRQVTQIKTETSIKLGDGDDGEEGHDVISRTTTTTTRIVTTLTTGDDEDQSEQQADDTDDLRHSVEVILNQFMSDDTAPVKSEDSISEHEK